MTKITKFYRLKNNINGALNFCQHRITKLMANSVLLAAVIFLRWWRFGGGLCTCGGATTALVVAGGMNLAVPIKWVTPCTKSQPHVCGQRPHGWSTARGMVLLTVELVDPPQTVDQCPPARCLAPRPSTCLPTCATCSTCKSI